MAAKGLELGVDIINDVSGLGSPDMIALAREADCDWGRDAPRHDSRRSAGHLAGRRGPFDAVEAWLLERMEVWDAEGLDLERIIFDPGIGFGKNRLQSLRLLRRVGEFRRHGLRVLVGHSRKSFMKSFTGGDESARDLATIGASLHLCAQGVDIIRVHDVPGHVAAYRGWSHLVG